MPHPLSEKIISIPEPDKASPLKKFQVKGQHVSGNFLRQAYFLYKLLNVMEEAPKVIVEFGGGYGLLTYLWKQMFADSKVVIVDIPEIIILQHNFISHALPGKRLGHVSLNSENRESYLNDHHFDILFVECDAIDYVNITPDVVLALASFQEIEKSVVDKYINWIQLHISNNGYFSGYNCHGQDNLSYQSPADFKYDNRWDIISLEQSKLVENNYRHLQTILKRRDNPDMNWHGKMKKLKEYYKALSNKNHSKMELYQKELITLQ